MTDFVSLPIAATRFSDNADTYALGSLVFSAANRNHINCGSFWRSNVQYSHFFWEAWIKPLYAGTPGYFVADTDGGDHCLLWGVQASDTNFYTISGNVNGDSGLTSFAPPNLMPYGYWTHVAVGWDGSHLLNWVNGILVHTQAYSSATRFNPGGNSGVLFIGGSDHNCFVGNIADVRGYEGYGRCKYTQSFTPERYFRSSSYIDPNLDVPQFHMPLHTKQGLYTDHGKFEGVSHHGVPEAVDSVAGYGEQSAPKNAYDLITYATGLITLGEYVPTPPTTPSGALIFDSFSRTDRTSLTMTSFNLGSTEAGSLGVKTWSGTNNSGVLNGRAFTMTQQGGGRVDTEGLDRDIRVDRMIGTTQMTGLLVRYKDDNNYYKITASDTLIEFEFAEAGVISFPSSFVVTTGWTTLRVVVQGTTMTVYVGTATEGTFTSAGSKTILNTAGATYAGLIYPGIKQAMSFDNFLVKAA